MCKQEMNLVKEIVALQQANDWKGIVGRFDCDNVETIPEEVRGQVAFAAGHLMDNYLEEGSSLLKRRKNREEINAAEEQVIYEKALLGYMKLYFTLEDISKLEPQNRQLLCVWGYRNYLLATGKQARELKALQKAYTGDRKGEINNGLKRISRKAEKESLEIYERLIALKPDDIKSIYRYARILQYKGNEYKEGATAVDLRSKDELLLKAMHSFDKVISIFQKLRPPEEKQRCRKEYERSRYQLIAIVCDKFMASITEKEQPVTYCNDAETPLLTVYGSSLLPRYAVLKQIKEKMDDLDALLGELGIAPNTPLTDEAVKAISRLDSNINVYDLLYRKAKMYLVMGLVYCSNLISGYTISHERILQKRKFYFDKSIEYAKYVADVKIELRRVGKESGGFVHELGLLGRLYYLQGNLETLIRHHEAMGCNSRLCRTPQFAEVGYYLGAMYIYDKHHRDDKKAMNYLNKIGEKSLYYKKARRLLADLEQGVI